MAAFAKHIEKYLQDHPNLSVAARQHLERWKQNPDADRILTKLQKRKSNVHREHRTNSGDELPIWAFIEAVLMLRNLSVEWSIFRDHPKLFRAAVKYVEAYEEATKSRSADIGRGGFLERYFGKAAEALKPIANMSPDLEDAVKGRMPVESETRAQIYFMQEISRFISENTGREHDEVVIALTQIAFGRDDIDLDSVQYAKQLSRRKSAKKN